MTENPYEAPRTSPTGPTDLPPRNEPLHARFVITERMLYRAYSFFAWQSRFMLLFTFPVTTIALGLLLVFLIIDAPRFYLWLCALTFLCMHILQILVPHVRVKLLIRDLEKRASAPLVGEQEVEVTNLKLLVRHVPDRQGRVLECRLKELIDVQFVGDMLLVTLKPGVVLPIPEQGHFGQDSFLSFCEEFARRYHARGDGGGSS